MKTISSLIFLMTSFSAYANNNVICQVYCEDPNGVSMESALGDVEATGPTDTLGLQLSMLTAQTKCGKRQVKRGDYFKNEDANAKNFAATIANSCFLVSDTPIGTPAK
jgi:hypothetical protein